MAKPKLFIGSSQKNLKIAQLLGNALEDCADVTIWNEDFFDHGYSFLETLVKKLEDYDFAAFVLAPDDVTFSKEISKPAPRDNVLFESGLFMGVLGRDRVFLVYDKSVELKLPSDLFGVTFAPYDGTLIDGDNPPAAVRKAVYDISSRIKASRFPYLIGDWKSEYPMTFEEGVPLVSEEGSVRTCGDWLYFVTKTSTHDDFYTASGRIILDRQIIGKWKSREASNNMEGVFVLTISPQANFMYGYFTSPDEKGGTVYATWILAKIAEGNEAKTNERLRKARSMLKGTVIFPSSIPPTSNS